MHYDAKKIYTHTIHTLYMVTTHTTPHKYHGRRGVNLSWFFAFFSHLDYVLGKRNSVFFICVFCTTEIHPHPPWYTPRDEEGVVTSFYHNVLLFFLHSFFCFDGRNATLTVFCYFFFCVSFHLLLLSSHYSIFHGI